MIGSHYIQDIELRMAGKPQNLQAAVRRSLADIDPNLIVLDMMSLSEQSAIDRVTRGTLHSEPPCRYEIISESSDSPRGNATTWARGEDGYGYRCIQAFHGSRVWTRFPPESERLRA